jgi:hypothetical protein
MFPVYQEMRPGDAPGPATPSAAGFPAAGRR